MTDPSSRDPLPIDPDSTALLVVDVQQAFVSDDGTPVRKGLDNTATVERLSAIRELIDVARRAGLTIGYTRSVRRADGMDAPQRVYDIVPGVYEGADPSCCAGTTDVEYPEGIDPAPDEFEVSKKRYDAFSGTPLDWHLRSSGVGTVVLCGYVTDVCVESTARTAHERGYNVVVAADCCAGSTREAHEATLRTVNRILGTTATRDELAATLA